MDRRMFAGVLAVLALAACGDDDGEAVTTAAPATSAATTPPPTSASPGTATTAASDDEFCTDLETLVGASNDLGAAFVAADGPRIGELLDELPAIVAAAQASAPDEISAEMDTAAGGFEEVAAAFEGVDFNDPAQVQAALGRVTGDPEAQEAGAAVQAYGSEACGIEGAEDPDDDDALADAPEPPECDVLDPAVAAEAAGLDVDVTDSDGSSDVNLPGFATKSCSYGNGALTLATLSFNDLDAVTDDFRANAENAGGTVVDVDLAGLPPSSLVTDVQGLVTVAVFDAEIPFSVGIPEGDPAQVVAAAEAVLEAQD